MKKPLAIIMLFIGFMLMNTATFAQTEEGDLVTFAEKMPEFTGGDLNKYIAKNIHYPDSARENGVEGKVLVQFTITTDGSVTDVKIIKGAGWGMDEEAMRVVKAMPRWTPGMQNGKPVNIRFTLPITFRLK